MSDQKGSYAVKVGWGRDLGRGSGLGMGANFSDSTEIFQILGNFGKSGNTQPGTHVRNASLA